MATLQAQLQQEQAQRQSLQRQLRQQAEGSRGGPSDSEAAARLADTLRQDLQAATEGKQGLQRQLQAAIKEQQELQAQLQEVQQRLEGLRVSLQSATRNSMPTFGSGLPANVAIAQDERCHGNQECSNANCGVQLKTGCSAAAALCLQPSMADVDALPMLCRRLMASCRLSSMQGQQTEAGCWQSRPTLS